MARLELIPVLIATALILYLSSSRVNGQESAAAPQIVQSQTRLAQKTDTSLKLFSAGKKSGYSIWGVQPRERVTELLKNLPKDVKVACEKLPEGQRRITLQDSSGRKLTLITSGAESSEEVLRVGVMPANQLLSIELDGVRILQGRFSSTEALRVTKAKLEGSGYKSSANGTKLFMDYVDNRLISVGLSTVDGTR